MVAASFTDLVFIPVKQVRNAAIEAGARAVADRDIDFAAVIVTGTVSVVAIVTSIVSVVAWQVGRVAEVAVERDMVVRDFDVRQPLPPRKTGGDLEGLARNISLVTCGAREIIFVVDQGVVQARGVMEVVFVIGYRVERVGVMASGMGRW